MKPGKIILLCGTICSGKSTYVSNHFNDPNSYYVFNQDHWIISLFGKDVPPREVFEDRWARIKELMKEVSEPMLRQGLNIVYDFGFWKPIHRTEFKEYAEKIGVDIEMIHFDISLDELERRRQYRNENLDENTFPFEKDFFDSLVAEFEAPTDSEGIAITTVT